MVIRTCFGLGLPVAFAACTGLLREAADVAAMSRGERTVRALDRDAAPDG